MALQRLLLACLLHIAGSLAIVSHCPSDAKDTCIRWGVAGASSSSGSSDVYFQIEAPSSYQWVGLGTGQRMAGSNMFIIYQDGNGNVTLSTRRATGHVMPQYTQRSDVELLQGSSVTGDKMIANIRCANGCGIDTTGDTNWIAAWRTGNSLDSTSAEESISEHSGKTRMTVDLAQASTQASGNPFLNPSAETNTTSGGSATQESDDDDESSNLPLAHGYLMFVVFGILYPIGSILMALTGKWFIHAGWQAIAYLGMWAGFGLGYVAARREHIFFDQAHTRMGTIVVALLGLQPFLGYAHHHLYKRYQRRTAVSHVHIWYGRILIILGIVTGGLGLQLAGASRAFTIAYSVVSGVLGAAYLAVAAVTSLRRRRTNTVGKRMSNESDR